MNTNTEGCPKRDVCPIIEHLERHLRSYHKQRKALGPLATRAARELDDTITRGDVSLAKLEIGCVNDGPLMMRAQKNDTTYTLTVCTSAIKPQEPGEPTTIIESDSL